MFNPTNILAEDEGLERSARRVGTSVLVRASGNPEAHRSKGMYALIVMVMLIDAFESCGVRKSHQKGTYRKHNSVDGRDVFDFTRRI